MNWINLNITVLSSEEFLGAEPTERATWLCLLAFCCQQENGGCIEGAAEWKDRKWQQVVRVTLKEARSACDLWTWEGDDLVVSFYPTEKEIEVQELRAIGKGKSETKARAARENGSLGGRPKKNPLGFENNPLETQKEPKITQAKPIEVEVEVEVRERESAGARRPTLTQAKAAAAQIGVTPAKAEEWWNAREASEWIKGMAGGGTSPVGSNWQADLKTYATRGGFSSQGQRGGPRQPGGYSEDTDLSKL